MDVVLHDLKLGDSSITLGLCRDFCVRVRHDCDEHIEEDNLNQEARPNEEYVAKNDLFTALTLVVVKLEFSLAKLKLTCKSV